MKRIAFILLLLAETTGFAAEVIQIYPGRESFSISQEAGRPWRPSDDVCGIRRGQEIYLGRVVRVSTRNAVVEVPPGYAIYGSERVGRCGGRYNVAGRRPAAAMESLTVTRSMPSRALQTSLGVGITTGFSYFFPTLDAHVVVSPRLTLGVTPFFISGKSGDADVTSLGAFVVGTYYLQQRAFRGFFLRGGLGAYAMKATASDGTTESATPLALSAVGGWRGLSVFGFSFEFALGGQYVMREKDTTSRIDFAGFLPQISADIGWDF